MGTLGILCCFCNVNCSAFRYLQKASAPEYLSSWALVGVAIGAGVIAYFTLDSTAKAAKAAAKSAEAVIRGERAIVIARPDSPDQSLLWGENEMFTWTLKNVGDTPAIVLETQAVFEVVDQGSLTELPEEPNYTQPINANGLQLVKEDSYSFETFLSDSQRRPRPIVQGLTMSIVKKHQVLRCYGYAKYLDIFEQEHYSRFCHYYRVGLRPGDAKFVWLLGAPAAYFEQQ